MTAQAPVSAKALRDMEIVTLSSDGVGPSGLGAGCGWLLIALEFQNSLCVIGCDVDTNVLGQGDTIHEGSGLLRIFERIVGREHHAIVAERGNRAGHGF